MFEFSHDIDVTSHEYSDGRVTQFVSCRCGWNYGDGLPTRLLAHQVGSSHVMSALADGYDWVWCR